MIPLFEQQNTLLYDILAIQEPWKNPFQNTTNHRLSQYFELAYLSDRNTRVCFLQTNAWLFQLGPSLMIQTIFQHFAFKRLMTVIYIHNIYNPCRGSSDPSSLPLLRQIMASVGQESEQIVIGDFNLHHPSWGGADVQADQEADELILLTEEFEMKQVLPRGTITWRRADSQSTIDLIFMTPLLRESLIQCHTSKSLDCHSDHEPIRTLINLSTIQASPRQSRNWKQTDVEKLREKLQTYLSTYT